MGKIYHTNTNKKKKTGVVNSDTVHCHKEIYEIREGC